jgi:hypothetical protein
LSFLFQGSSNAVAAFTDVAHNLGTLSTELSNIESSGFSFLTSGDGTGFIADLTSLRGTIDQLNNDSTALSGAASFAGGLSPQDGALYLSLQTELASAKNFLDAFVPWLSEPGAHHLLVLLQNPSEIRPAGGFLGSYADITIASGTVTNVAVHDVADVDTTFKEKIIPPVPLQLEVTNWRPADANWFFDFPTSASETISFFDASGLYAASSTTFDAAIAVSPKVISDLLSITGPITAGSPTTTFTADNFLVQIQKIVQNGQATSATYPKAVLRSLSSALFTDLASSTDDQKQQLFATALDWAAKKDVMVYFKDPSLESFAEAYGAGGDVYQLPQKFNGDYLAVVDANVTGGKSDIYVSSTVDWTAEINTDGTIADQVVITRKHNGNTSPYWWYRVTDTDYLQLFVPQGTTITNSSGTVQKKVR